MYHEACLNELMRYSRKCILCGEVIQKAEEVSKMEEMEEMEEMEAMMMEESMME